VAVKISPIGRQAYDQGLPSVHPRETPAGDYSIDEHLVRRLLREQHPDLAELGLQQMESGWDNEMVRLGDTLAVRLPRRALAVKLIEHEQRWLPRLAPRLPLAVPVPLRIGVPTAEYPSHWSIVPWLEGTAADLSPPSEDQVGRFASFVRALHVPAPPEAPHNPYRSVSLAERADRVREQLQHRAQHGEVDAAVRRVWNAALSAPCDIPSSWIHGDLHARNVLVSDTEICGVVDWGDLAAGDRATDLAAVWILFATLHARCAALEALPEVSDATWIRARGWAVIFGLVLTELRDPRHARIGSQTLQHLAEGP
jgi:aminoglycoside phosphotransferase (APT) family kinase protein